MSLASRLAASALSLVTLAIGCSAPPQSSGESAGNSAEAIINGKNSDASQDAVVLIYDTAGFACTGTLLAPNLVLTARHCVSNIDEATAAQCADGAVTTDYTPSSLNIIVGAKAPSSASAVAAKGKQIIHDASSNLCNHDMALIVLDTMIPDAKIAPIRLDSLPKAGETFTAVGWGVTTTTTSPSVRQQRTAIPIVAVAATAEGVGSTEFLTGEASCEGDSGGPALATKTGAVIGTVSRGGNGQQPNQNNPSNSCTGTDAQNIYSAPMGFKAVILQGYKAAGQDPWLEGQPDPRLAHFGEPCTTNGDCGSNACYQANGKGVCTQDCSTDACPTGYDCSTDGTNVCIAHVDTAPLSGADGGAANGATNTTVTAGCATAPGQSGSNGTWLGLGIAALAVAARRRKRA